MRVKVVQAMALGKAVVTTTRGTSGLDIAAGDPPLAIGDDALTFARATSTLLTTDTARHDLGRRARAFVADRHSPSAYLQRLEQMLSEFPIAE